MDTTNDNDYFELEPFEQYKPHESKFSASLKWLLSKSSQTCISEPFFEENELGKSLRGEVVQELINGNLYCSACSNLFSKNFDQISHILEYMASNSIMVTDENDEPVTWQIISQDSPFYVSAHLALIDSIMMYYSLRIMQFDSVYNSIRKYTQQAACDQMPSNLEQVCSYWLNNITKIVVDCLENECDAFNRQSSLVKCQPHIFLNQIDHDIAKSLACGTILSSLIVFYTSDIEIDLSDICLQENVGFEERVENLNLIKEFCEKFLGPKSFCFTFEDFLYSPLEMNINKLAFIAELFYFFELNPIPNLVEKNHFEKFKEYIKRYMKKHYHATTPFLSARIGDVTRNSFIKKSPYTPSQSTEIKMSKAVSNASSLLDNVSLEASNNFDFVATSLASKFKLNENGDYAEIENEDDDLMSEEMPPSEQNSMFSSRTYVKLSSTNRMNFNENTQDKDSDYSGQVESGMKTVRVNSSNTNLPNVTEQGSVHIDKSTGLVRRLSVTARPGDIFYKVKDVTESSSNTDNSEPNHESEEQEIVIKPQEPNVNMNTWRKTTTWNSKRNQQIDCDSGRQTPKLESEKCSNTANIEPGSPMFAKELLSIRQAMEARRLDMILNYNLRMQLKEKKTSMERDKRKLETELEKQRQNIGKQVFLQVVQKKSQIQDQVSQIGGSQKSTQSPNNSTCESPTPSQLTSSPNSSNLSHTNREATRRQWDKTPKNFINDFEQNNKEDYLPNNQNTGTSSVSSLSTPNSSAAQSPPLNSAKKQPSPKSNAESMTVDLTKAYYSRDEVIKAIDSLKDKYINTNAMSKTNQSSNHSTSNNMVKDIEVLNNKLTELQAEINRLTLLQQNQPGKNKDTNSRQSEQISEQKKQEIDQIENQNGPFFISIGNGTAKREKPALSSKKNLIFIKTNDEKDDKKPSNTTNNLLMTAVKNGNSEQSTKTICDEANQLANDGHEGDIDASDGDTIDYKQRKREMIIQKQLERRQQQELRRMQLEEERAQKAEELRQKEEELAMKKMVEKNRKETIFQAYIDKKKQSEIESMSGCFGPPNSLMNAKKFHSTNRLKPSTKSNTQNLFDPYDQASLYSERSTNGQYSSNTIVKTYSTNNLYQVGPNKNLAPTKKTNRVSRPPSCARPTISSLRKMNRTFSLNNVSEVGKAVKQAEQEPKILPLTQASLAIANATSLAQNNESMIRMMSDNSKLGSKYASSNYLNDISRQYQPQQTRTTPRRRTPRNAEEFLLSQGITDPEGYLSKGYYVGSMLDLSKFAKPAHNSESAEPKAEENHPSSSSSSSMNGFQKTQKSFFLEANGIKRRNSVHETSLSMANLNFIGNAEPAFESKPTSRNQKYYRTLNNYNKMRSMTTNIVATQNQYDDQLNDGSNGSSATGSDSSSSPTPSMQQKLAYHNASNLGPLMSAVSKMENLSTISPSSTKTLNTFLENRFNNEDDYDDYEYLERNLGAEPLNSSFNQRKKDINTTTNTNVTDYYTDESNSCHNEEILSNQFIQQLGNQNFMSKNSITSKIGANTMHQVNNWDHTSLASTNSIYSGDDLFSIALIETSSKLASRRLSQLSASKQPINTSYIISTSIDSSLSLTDESTIKNSPNNWTRCSVSAGNKMKSKKTASNNHTVDKSSPSTNTYARKRTTLPSSATFCAAKTPDSGPKRVSHLANQNNQFINQSPSLNLNNINEADYSGPKLYKRLIGKTNKSTIINSLNQLVLAGTVNAQLRKQVIEEIEASDARHFVILFRDYHLQYRGVYSYTSESDYIEKIIGQGPARISEEMIEKYYKYNSGGKQFSPVQTKHLSIQCDAVTIHSTYWQTRKASNPVTNVNQMGYNQSQYSNYSHSPMAGNQGTLRR